MPLGRGAGWVAERIGAPRTFPLAGILCALAAALFAWKLPALRHAILHAIRARGIIPLPNDQINSWNRPSLSPNPAPSPLTFNRPAVYNAMNPELILAMRDALGQIVAQKMCRR